MTTCATCRYYVPDEPPTPTPDEGECHASPPRMVTDDHIGWVATRPQVRQDDRACRYHREGHPVRPVDTGAV